MKKKLIFTLIMIIGLSAAAGCAGKDSAGHSSGNIKTVEDVLQEGIKSEDKDTGENAETGNSSETTAQAEPKETTEIEETAEPEKTSEPEEISKSENASIQDAEETSKDEPKEAAQETPQDEDIDVDLTVLSSTMVYSEVYNMMVKPDDYIGKTVKMTGMYSYYHDDATGNDYHACIIQDATACCAQGIEFTTTDEFKYPDDYPEMGDDVTVIGRFDIYYEGDFCFMTLLDARLVDA